MTSVLRPDTLLHIAEPDVWAAALGAGEYRAASLATEGFIHCSSPSQVLTTAARYYAGRTDGARSYTDFYAISSCLN